MQKNKIGEPIQYEGRTYQFYEPASPTELTEDRRSQIEIEYYKAFVLKTGFQDLMKISVKMKKAYANANHEKATPEDKEKAWETVSKCFGYIDLIGTKDFAIEPMIDICSFYFYLEGEPDKIQSEWISKKKILLRETMQLGFFLNVLVKEWSKLEPSLKDISGDYMIKIHNIMASSVYSRSLQTSLDISPNVIRQRPESTDS